MAKVSGLGDRLYVGAFDLSGDVGSVQRISGAVQVLDVNGISCSAYERVLGLRDSTIEFTSYWNDSAGGAWAVLSLLPTTDVGVSYFKGHTLGAVCANLNAKELDYSPTRANDGAITMASTFSGTTTSKFNLGWGVELTDGQRTDTSATNPTSGLDDLSGSPTSTSFGATVWVHLLSFTGTSVTFTLRDAATEPTYANVTGGASSAMTAVGFQRWQTATTETIRRYLTIGTSGTFSSAVFIVGVVRHTVTAI